MRITSANKRRNKHGVIKVGHNDRSFDISKADHIDKSKICQNLSWTWNGSKSQEESEQSFYEAYFTQGLEAQNQRYLKQRHKDKCKTIEQIRQDPKQCPEECIRQVGKHGENVDRNMMVTIMNEYLAWKAQRFPQVKTINCYMHFDEPDAQDHMHERCVYIGHDKYGHMVPSQRKALKEMGIERPDPTKPEGRYNNAKITFDKMCREKFAEICKKKGLAIELEPQDPSRTGLSLLELKARTAKEEREKAEQKLQEAEQKIEQLVQEKEAALQEATEAHKLQRELYMQYANGQSVKTYGELPAQEEKKGFRGQVTQEARPSCILVEKEDFKRMRDAAAYHYKVDYTETQMEQLTKRLSTTEAVKELKRQNEELKEQLSEAQSLIQSLKSQLNRAKEFMKKFNLIEKYKQWQQDKQLDKEFYFEGELKEEQEMK